VRVFDLQPDSGTAFYKLVWRPKTDLPKGVIQWRRDLHGYRYGTPPTVWLCMYTVYRAGRTRSLWQALNSKIANCKDAQKEAGHRLCGNLRMLGRLSLRAMPYQLDPGGFEVLLVRKGGRAPKVGAHSTVFVSPR
jgi:hypothetical protein